MELKEALLKRRSVRKFTDKPVPKEYIDELLHAAMSGPSACNRRPWEFFVVTNEEVLEKLREEKVKPTAMIDISDGLSSELMHICKQSSVGCRIYEERIPIDYQTAIMAEELNMNVMTCALNGGEDYELLFTVPIADHEKVAAMKDIRVIGHIVSESMGNAMITRDGVEMQLRAQGWTMESAE